MIMGDTIEWNINRIKHIPTDLLVTRGRPISTTSIGRKPILTCTKAVFQGNPFLPRPDERVYSRVRLFHIIIFCCLATIKYWLWNRPEKARTDYQEILNIGQPLVMTHGQKEWYYIIWQPMSALERQKSNSSLLPSRMPSSLYVQIRHFVPNVFPNKNLYRWSMRQMTFSY